MVVSRAASMVRPVLVVVARIYCVASLKERREPTTYPCIAFGWPGLRRMGESSPDSNPPHKGRESPKCRRTVLPKTRRHSDSPISSSVLIDVADHGLEDDAGMHDLGELLRV